METIESATTGKRPLKNKGGCVLLAKGSSSDPDFGIPICLTCPRPTCIEDQPYYRKASPALVIKVTAGGKRIVVNKRGEKG